MGYAATTHNTVLLLSKLLANGQWPFYHMMGTALLFSVTSFFLLASGTRIHGSTPPPEAAERKWVFLRGLCGTSNLLSQLLAVRSGVPMGDIAAFTSINMVFAALLGRLFLGEALGRVHIVALSSSLAGALLISKPGFIFGEPASSSASGVGYLFALAAGVSQAALFICARKSRGSSVLYHSLASQSCAGMTMLLICATGVIEDSSLSNVATFPWEAVGWTGLLYLCVFTGTFFLSSAAKMCPAAVSAMVCTAAHMIIGYVVQVLFLGVTPEMSTVGGAILMFAGVVVMVVARAAAASPAVSPTVEDAVGQSCAVSEAGSSTTTSLPDEDDTESLASFVSSEFAVWAPHEKSVRQRFPSFTGVLDTSQPAAQRIGIVPTLMQTI